ncbi:hypothetical protein N7509_008049 [Penicillium cosmopolitanum]|uniref:Uncharacterized protein n=1 Tax=Penicillium cosmopolitanum TaxID=1131564 RepID=A0A9W9W044_9EURO|nr:uncharacterized protein N7509_008049 [Penicillium cosmopolitanum]KAJ5392559.1 hypothetical protein N7509_008049 [Penicillium cosmopolitanum]
MADAGFMGVFSRSPFHADSVLFQSTATLDPRDESGRLDAYRVQESNQRLPMGIGCALSFGHGVSLGCYPGVRCVRCAGSAPMRSIQLVQIQGWTVLGQDVILGNGK